jgi:serine protease AprX
VVVAAAGNHGIDSGGSTGYAGITSPGNAPSALTVGAVDTKNTGSRIDDRVAPFSSRGPSWFDGFAKPEVVAPGVALASDAPDGGELYDAYPQLRLSGRDRKLARLSGTSMAAATATGVAALVLETSRSVNHGEGLTPNATKAVLQYTSIPVVQADGTPFDALAQGAGQINGRGAIALSWLINTGTAAGQPWLRLPLLPVSLIDGRLHAWSRALVWDDAVIRQSNAIYVNSQLWNDNIVWGTGCDTDDAQCLATVWGAAANVDNIVWGTGAAWAAALVFADRVVGFFAGDNIVWGTLAGLGEENIVWGTVIGADNIVWGTLRGDNIVWGTMRGDNIVWGTVRGDNIVWGTWGADNIVWGTVATLDGGRR